MRFNRLMVIALLTGCKAAPVPSSSSSYSEDLSIHRPVAIVELKEEEENEEKTKEAKIINEQYTPLEGHIKNELDSIAKIAYAENKAGKYVDGFVIQIYSGGSRDEANDARYKMNDFFPELDAKMSYHQPSFRVKAGKFTDRLEANRIYEQVKKEFPRALLIPERFLLIYE